MPEIQFDSRSPAVAVDLHFAANYAGSVADQASISIGDHVELRRAGAPVMGKVTWGDDGGNLVVEILEQDDGSPRMAGLRLGSTVPVRLVNIFACHKGADSSGGRG